MLLDRYRIQCDEFYGLWLLADELIYQLRSKFPDIQISTQDPPVLDDYVPIVDEHYRVRSILVLFLLRWLTNFFFWGVGVYVSQNLLSIF